MKGFILAIFALVVALVNAAVVRKSDDDFSLLTREIAESNTHMVLGTLPDGRRRIALYDNEEYLGAIEEGPGGEFEAIVYDPYGNVVDVDEEVDEEVDGEDNKLKARQAALINQLVRRLARFISTFGPKAWNFFRCIGLQVSINCADKLLQCIPAGVGGPNPSIARCIAGITCSGKSFASCAALLR